MGSGRGNRSERDESGGEVQGKRRRDIKVWEGKGRKKWNEGMVREGKEGEKRNGEERKGKGG